MEEGLICGQGRERHGMWICYERSVVAVDRDGIWTVGECSR